MAGSIYSLLRYIGYAEDTISQEGGAYFIEARDYVRDYPISGRDESQVADTYMHLSLAVEHIRSAQRELTRAREIITPTARARLRVSS